MAKVKRHPALSVVMAVHNCEAFLAAAIHSVLQQSFRDFEFIIIDDGSNDRSGLILQEFRRKHSRIHLIINKSQRGLAASLNTGLAAARGDLVARMDADDISMPERFALQITAFREEKDLVLLGSEVEFLTADGLFLGKRGQRVAHKDIRAQLLRGDGSAIVHPTAMFRRRAALDAGGYNEQFVTAQDLDFFLRLSELGSIRNLEEALLGWRQHGASINHTLSRTWPEMKALAISRTIERLGGELYAQELFAAESEYFFPVDDLAIAKLALEKGRCWAAIILLARRLRSGPHRISAVTALLRALLQSLKKAR